MRFHYARCRYAIIFDATAAALFFLSFLSAAAAFHEIRHVIRHAADDYFHYAEAQPPDDELRCHIIYIFSARFDASRFFAAPLMPLSCLIAPRFIITPFRFAIYATRRHRYYAY